MATYSVDSSAIVKRYVTEVGSSWVESICDVALNNTICLVRITLAEVASAFFRRHREGTLTATECNDLLAAFLSDCKTQYQIVGVTPDIVNLAIQLIRRHPLRGYDAVQLAAAILINRHLSKNKLPPLTFISADNRLCTAATAEEIAADNPNLHP